ERVKALLSLPIPHINRTLIVSYCDDDSLKSDIDIEDVIQILASVAMDDRPEMAYTSSSQALKYFLDNKGGGEQRCQSLLPLLPDILFLYDRIPALAKEAWNANGGSFGSLSMIAGESPRKRPFIQPLSKTRLDFTPHRSWVLPILSSLLVLVDEESSEPAWLVNPELAISVTIHKQFTECKNVFDEVKRHNQVGR